MKEQCLVSKLSRVLSIVLVSFIFLSSCKDDGNGETESLSSGEIESLSSIAGTYKIISIKEGVGTRPEGYQYDVYDNERDALLLYKSYSIYKIYNEIISAVEEGKLYFIINSKGEVDVESEKEVSVDGKWFNSTLFFGNKYELVDGIGRSYIYGYGYYFAHGLEGKNTIVKIEKAGSEFWFRFVRGYDGERSGIDWPKMTLWKAKKVW